MGSASLLCIRFASASMSLTDCMRCVRFVHGLHICSCVHFGLFAYVRCRRVRVREEQSCERSAGETRLRAGRRALCDHQEERRGRAPAPQVRRRRLTVSTYCSNFRADQTSFMITICVCLCHRRRVNMKTEGALMVIYKTRGGGTSGEN